MLTSKRQIKILATIRQGEVGGGETHLIGLLENLDRSLYHPVVLSFTRGHMVERVEALGIKCYVVKTNNAFDLTVGRKVYKILKKEAVDVVHAHGTRAYTNVILQAKALNIPVIYTVHGWSFHDDQNLLNKHLRIGIERLLVKNACRTILVSDSNHLTGKKHLKNSKFDVIPNGVDLQRFNMGVVTHDIRKELGIPSSAFLLGFIARVTKQKDPLGMIEGFYLAHKQCPDICLLMIGQGDLKERAMLKVKELNIQSSVYFDDFRQDIPEILKSIDVFCLPSLWEGLPIGLIEAMAVGKAVIATNVDGSKEIIQHARNGLLTKPENPKDLADAIIHLYCHETLKTKIEREARSTIVKKYDLTRMVKQTEQIYQTLII
jgi:glycosyltransferase involved in cell wall biosynthesis